MIVLTGTVRIPADKLDQARPLMKAVIEATRQEDGCLFYSFGEDVLDPGLIVVAEAWRDEACLCAHLGSPHFHAWREANAALGVTDRQLTVYEAVSSKPL
ncbi:MAG: putative quinol monooxygenase [Caulobacteraceae bacterium]